MLEHTQHTKKSSEGLAETSEREERNKRPIGRTKYFCRSSSRSCIGTYCWTHNKGNKRRRVSLTLGTPGKKESLFSFSFVLCLNSTIRVSLPSTKSFLSFSFSSLSLFLSPNLLSLVLRNYTQHLSGATYPFERERERNGGRKRKKREQREKEREDEEEKEKTASFQNRAAEEKKEEYREREPVGPRNLSFSGCPRSCKEKKKKK